MQSNDSIELNGGWETNVVISYLPRTRQSDVSVLNRNRNHVRHVTLKIKEFLEVESVYLLNMIVKCNMVFMWLNLIVNHILIVFS